MKYIEIHGPRNGSRSLRKVRWAKSIIPRLYDEDADYGPSRGKRVDTIEERERWCGGYWSNVRKFVDSCAGQHINVVWSNLTHAADHRSDRGHIARSAFRGALATYTDKYLYGKVVLDHNGIIQPRPIETAWRKRHQKSKLHAGFAEKDLYGLKSAVLEDPENSKVLYERCRKVIGFRGCNCTVHNIWSHYVGFCDNPDPTGRVCYSTSYGYCFLACRIHGNNPVFERLWFRLDVAHKSKDWCDPIFAKLGGITWHGQDRDTCYALSEYRGSILLVKRSSASKRDMKNIRRLLD